MCSWICEPQKITSIPIWDEEIHARDIFEKLVKAQPRDERVQFCLEVLDGTLAIQDFSDSAESDSRLMHRLSLLQVREAAVKYLIATYGSGCVEYLISLVTTHGSLIFKVNLPEEPSTIAEFIVTSSIRTGLSPRFT